MKTILDADLYSSICQNFTNVDMKKILFCVTNFFRHLSWGNAIYENTLGESADSEGNYHSIENSCDRQIY